MNVQMPDGSVVAFPDSMRDTEVNSAIEQHLGQQTPSAMDNFSNNAANRIISVAKNPQISHAIGQGYGMAGDAVGQATSALTPDTLTDSAHDTANLLNKTDMGQKLGDMLLSGKNAVQSFSTNYPKATQALGDLANVASWSGGSEGVSKIEGAGESLGLGDALYNSGKASKDAAHQQYIQDLILPKETPTVKADMATRTKQINGTNTYQPTPQEMQIASSVAAIPEVSKSNSYVKNLNLIQDANHQEAQALKQRLQANDVPISDDVIQNTLANVHQSISANPYISGVDATKAATNVVNKALDIITSKPQTASSMLDARKELDAWVSRQKGDKAFNPALDSPITTAVQQVRQAMNGIVADAVPSADVRASLQKQSNLYHAAENIAPKAAGESATRIGRMMQNITPHSGVGKIAGAAGLGVAAEIVPHIPLSVAVPAAAGYGLYKGATAPSTRMALGKMLGVSTDALK